MKLCYLCLQIVIFISLLIAGMDQKAPTFPENNAPEHIPGSNMIGAGRGGRINKWKNDKKNQTSVNDSQITTGSVQGGDKK